jgi:DNA replication licensing factor MCM5
VGDKCRYVDQQTLKLQEAPESVPTGEMPRNIILCAERSLADRVAPGTRVSVRCVALYAV